MTLDMGNRLKKMKSYALDQALLARLEAWRQAQTVAPPATAIIEAGLRMFLDAHEGRFVGDVFVRSDPRERELKTLAQELAKKSTRKK